MQWWLISCSHKQEQKCIKHFHHGSCAHAKHKNFVANVDSQSEFLFGCSSFTHIILSMTIVSMIQVMTTKVSQRRLQKVTIVPLNHKLCLE